MYTLRNIAAATALVAGLVASTDAASCVESGGNYYCNEVEQVTYLNLGGSNSYNKVTSMSSSDGSCAKSAYAYSGTNAPFDEEVSYDSLASLVR